MLPPIHFSTQSAHQGALALRRLACLCLLLALWMTGAAALAQSAPTAALPSPTANCVVGAQNRYAPLDPVTGHYELSNLPGNGLIPFGVGASAQPFRVRATCDDGSTGETPMAFPEFEQRVVTMGDIVWGQKAPIATQMSLQLPETELPSDEVCFMRLLVYLLRPLRPIHI